MKRIAAILGLACLAASLIGCSTPTDSTVQIPGGLYADAFEATRQSLRDYHLTLDRVDAASGVITTAMKPTSGFATPWDLEQSGADQEWEDFINRQRRYVRVTFAPADRPTASAGPRDPAAAKAAATEDLRDFQGPIVATVSVSVERVQRPGWQVNTKSINQSTFTRDPALAAEGKFPTYTVELEPDRRLAGRLAATIRKKLDQREGRPQSQPQPAAGDESIPTPASPDAGSAADGR